MTLEIKEGRYYVNRLGEKRGPISLTRYEDYPFSDGGFTYAKNGAFSPYESMRHKDLIAEWTDPAEEPEWGEWECHSKALEEKINHGCDYMYRRIGRKHEYCVHKPRPVTMLVDVIDGKPDLSTLRPVTE